MLPIQRVLKLRPTDKTMQNIFYALPRVAGVSLFAPINIMQGIYAKHYGLPLTTIASVILFVRLFDAVTDPIIGILSDKHHLKYGTRKPFMVAGAILMAIGGYFLYTPPINVSVTYFCLWFMAFYLGFTLFEIPHLAWGGEISHDTQEKNQTYNLRTAAGYSGLVLFYSLPLLPIWETSEITPETLKFSAVLSGFLILPLLYFSMKKVPNGRCYKVNNSQSDKKYVGHRKKQEVIKVIKSVVYNKPLLLFLGAFVFAGGSLGVWLGLLFIFIDVYLGMGALFSEIFLIALIVGVVASLVWIRVARYVGKKNAWLIAMVLGVMSFGYTGVIEPENVSYESLLFLLIINTLCFVCVESLPQSMLSDIVDYSTLKFGSYRGSTYFSLYLFTFKGAFALGGALGIGIAGWYGFDPTKSLNTVTSVQGLRIAMVWIPVLLALLSIIFIVLSPINERRHRIIRQRLLALYGG